MLNLRLCLGAFVVGLSNALFVLASPASATHSPFGVYPDCIGPAIPVETQGWWQENTDAVPRHFHIAACIPNARTTDPNAKIVEEDLENVPVTVRVVTFNNPDIVEYVKWSWDGDTQEKVDVNWQCPAGNGEEQCTWYEDLTLNTTEAKVALEQLRFNTKIEPNEFGKKHLLSLNFQVWAPRPNGAHESATNPRGKSWYTGLDYAQVNVNYADFFNGEADYNLARPVVSGVVPIRAEHSRGEGIEVWSTLWLDTNFHSCPEFHDNAVVGIPDPDPLRCPGLLLYKVRGNAELTYMWDTTALADGEHALFFQTIETDSTGTHAGGLKLFFDVQNGPLPELDAAVTALDAPASVELGQPVNVNAVIKNLGSSAANNIGVMLEVADSPGSPPIFVTDPPTLVSLEAGRSTTVQFEWATADRSEGSYNLKVLTDLAGDENPVNDFRDATVALLGEPETYGVSGFIVNSISTKGTWTAEVTPIVTDNNGSPLSGVDVAGHWDDSSASLGDCTTWESGECDIPIALYGIRKKVNGATFTVDSVEDTGTSGLLFGAWSLTSVSIAKP